MTREEGSVAIWPLLVEVAGKRGKCNYGEIAGRLAYKSALPIISMLGGIMWYCLDFALPPLTIVVVNKRTGLPGAGLIVQGTVESETAKVWNHDWSREKAPTIADYVAANANNK